MRSVFTSPRLENVEAVAKMLAEAGIEVRVSQDRSYKGNRRRPFSYRDNANAEPNPQVWIIKAEDQPKARAMLREAGLIDSTRQGFGSTGASQSPTFLPTTVTASIARKRDARATMVMRVRLFLLAVITVVTVLYFTRILHA